ncbi:hypothetical protein VTK56DRAFT_1972 [Thermocarpiscus australiensis]
MPQQLLQVTWSRTRGSSTLARKPIKCAQRKTLVLQQRIRIHGPVRAPGAFSRYWIVRRGLKLCFLANGLNSTLPSTTTCSWASTRLRSGLFPSIAFRFLNGQLWVATPTARCRFQASGLSIPMNPSCCIDGSPCSGVVIGPRCPVIFRFHLFETGQNRPSSSALRSHATGSCPC